MTFEDWWEAQNFFALRGIPVSERFMEVAKRAWNAARGIEGHTFWPEIDRVENLIQRIKT